MVELGTAPTPPGVPDLVDAAFDEGGPLATTYAVVIVQGGAVVAERYGGALPSFDHPPTPVEPTTPLLSWSMAKSMLHAVVGMLVADGLLVLDAPAPVPEWSAPGDPRSAITLDDLLAMRDGLQWSEDYVDAGVSDVIEMLFGPVGMTTATPTFDAAGTWVASSYVHATARDYARFGLLYLHDGCVGGERLLPEGWVEHGTRVRSVDPEDGDLYGAHWWVVGDEHGTFRAAGYEGQSITVCPPLDLVVVRLGRTPAERAEHLVRWRADVVAAFAAAG